MQKTTMTFLILSLLINSSLIIFDVACVKADTSIKIMPLGDSLTYGTYYESSGGYRQKLFTDLTNAGFNVDFVGSQNSGVSFDSDHEGHTAWNTSQIRSSIYDFLTSYSPDIVLLHIGTNDIEAGTENVTEIEGILDNIDTYENNLSRNITVILARIILRNDTSVLDDNTKAFNNAVAAMASTRIASGDDIIIVDMENALTYPDDVTDNVHPNMVGYEKMAAVWYNAVYNELITKMLIADFTASPRSGPPPLTVTFSDASSSDEGIISWSWDFGDGTTSTDQNPTHNFHVGTYTVSLTVGESDGDNDTETKTAYITVARPVNKVPIADAGGPYTGTEGITISFDGSNSSDSDGTIVSYLWDFGDGQTSTDQNPTHIYVQNGTYPVALTVTDDDSVTDTGITSAVIADAKPLASFIALPTSGTRPLTVNFTDTSISYDGVVSWVWNFGDGQTSSDQNPNHTYSEGKYHVSLMVVEADGDSNTLTKNNYITAQPPPNSLPIANFGIQSSANPAINEEISFTDQSIDADGTVTSWIWNFGDGNTATTQNPIHKFQSVGTYTITLTVKDDDGATDTITKQLTIHEINPPETIDDYDELWHNSDITIALTAIDDYSGVEETYYIINDGSIKQLSIDGQPRITTEGANNTLEYWSIDKAGNEETHHVIDVKIDKTSPTADAGQDMTVNEEAIVLFDGSSSIDNVAITSYKWSLFDGTLQTLDGVNPQYIFHTPGVYTANLTVSDAVLNSAFDTITVTVIDISDPVSNAGNDQVVHEGVTVTFDGSASTDNVEIVSYRWDFIDVVPQQLIGVNPTYTFQYAGVHEVMLTVLDNQGNSGTDKVAVTVIDDTWPASNAGPDQIVEEDKWVVFDGSSSSDNVGIISYVWTFTDEKLQTMQGVNTSYVFETPGIYVVTLTVSDAEGLSSNDTVTIIVRDVTAPTIEIEDYAAVIENVPITFNASTFDNAGVVNYNWIFGDGTNENTSGSTVMHIYTEPGIYNVELTVTDITGNVNGTFISIVVHRDTDGDFLADHLDADDDGDGIPDDWESRYDLDPMDPSDASRDSDGDGISNLEEYESGKDPKVYDISNYTLSIVLVIAIVISMIGFGIFYSRSYRSK